MFDDRLKKLRIKKGLNMKETARNLNIPYTTYVGYEKNDREPNSEILIELANFFNCSIDYLIGRSTQISLNIENKINEETSNIKNKDVLKEQLINNYDELNEDGQKRLVEYSDDLCASNKYTKSNSIYNKINA